MNRRDREVIGGLLVVLALLAVAMAWPAGPPPPAAVGSSPSPSIALSASPSPVVDAYREGRLGRPTAVSPFGARTQADRDLVALVFSGLVRLGPGRSIEPDLAISWTSDATGSSWLFTLRPDARWHDGLPVTAEDVAFTIHTLQDPDFTGSGDASWRDVTVSVVDEATVRFQFATPLGDFLEAATQAIAPAHLLEGIPADAMASHPFGQRPVGSGPYRLVSWNAGEAILEPAAGVRAPTEPGPSASASFGPTVGLLPRLDIRYFADPAALAAAYRAGELDAAVDLPPATAVELGAAPGSTLVRYPRSTLTTLVFDLRPGRPEFRDARTRRGLLEAIDRDGIIAEALAGAATRADAPIPPGSWAFDPAVSPPIAFDREAAAAALTSAGWKKPAAGWIAPGATKPYELEVVTPDEASNSLVWATTQRVAEGWRAFGLDVTVVELPPAAYIARLRDRTFQAIMVDVEIGRDPDLYPLLASTQATSTGSNLSGIQDPALDKLLEAARKPGPDDRRRAAWRALQVKLADELPLVPLYFRDLPIVLSKRVSGPTVRPLGDPSDRFWDVLTWRLASAR